MTTTTIRRGLAALVGALALASPAHAIDTDGDPNPSRCLRDLYVPYTNATPRVLALGQSTTLSWRVKVPDNCANVIIRLDGQPVSREGSRAVTPVATTNYELTAQDSGLPRRIATISVRVDIPPEVTITRNDQAPLLRQALAQPNEVIHVADGVELNLSYFTNLRVADGVTLTGTRSPRHPGPRLYMSVRQARLFIIEGDHVRISGLRIQGPDMGVADGSDPDPKAILVNSHRDVEIFNNEIYGWKGAAVEVLDDYGVSAPETADVRIHDNFIHHNQRRGSLGYGVVVGNGAYALIERNVFDYNRHAIAGDGSDGSGYLAYRNLVLSHGGLHDSYAGVWTHTHQFDMHGQGSCWPKEFNCGTAGYSMSVRFNTFHYTEAEAIHLRGTPQRTPYGAFVVSNVFSHGSVDDAVDQNERGLYLSGNRVADRDRVVTLSNATSCDFDGDGRGDRFMATGQTWWYASPVTNQWTYLNTSLDMLPGLTLRHVDGDGRCDVVRGTQWSSGGTRPWQPLP